MPVKKFRSGPQPVIAVSRPTPRQFCRELASEIYLVTWTLYKLMIPTLLIVKLLGAHVSGVIWLRLLFTMLTLAIITRWLKRRSDRFMERWLFNRYVHSMQGGRNEGEPEKAI